MKTVTVTDSPVGETSKGAAALQLAFEPAPAGTGLAEAMATAEQDVKATRDRRAEEERAASQRRAALD